MANTYNLAFFQVQLGQPQKALETLQNGLDHGLWYGPWDFEAEVWSPIKELENFAEVKSRSQARLEEAQKLAKPKLTIVTPKDFVTERFILLLAVFKHCELR